MEDSHLAILNLVEGVSLFAVFDGHGGFEVAEYVKIHFPDELQKWIKTAQSANYEEGLKHTFLKMDELLQTNEGKNELNEIYTKSGKAPKSFLTKSSEDAANFVGCTACVILITKTKIYSANAGDSRSMLIKGSTCLALSEDHKPDLPNEKKRIEKAKGFVDDNRVNGSLNLSRSIGDFDFKRNKELKYDEQMVIAVPDVKVESISSDTNFVLIACDGVWDVLSCQQAGDFINDKYKSVDKKSKMSKILEAMMDKIIAPEVTNSGGIGCDNMTAVLIQIKN